MKRDSKSTLLLQLIFRGPKMSNLSVTSPRKQDKGLVELEVLEGATTTVSKEKPNQR